MFAETLAALLLRLKGHRNRRAALQDAGRRDRPRGAERKAARLRRSEAAQDRRRMPAGRCRPSRGGASSGQRNIGWPGIPALRATTWRSTWCWRRLGPGRAMSPTPFRCSHIAELGLSNSAYKGAMSPQSRLPDGPDRAHRYQGRFDLRPAARSAMARPRRVLLHAEQSLAARRQADRRRPQPHRRGQARRPLSPGASKAGGSRRVSTWCSSAKIRPSTWPTSPPRICWSASSPKTLVVNDPASVRNAPEKVFVLDFLDLMPPTLVTRSPGRDPRLPRRA